MISQNDFQRRWLAIEQPVLNAVRRVGKSGRYILGEQVQAFEAALAKGWGIEHAVGVANGMDAIEIGLRCLGLCHGDKVLTTPLSAFATTLAIIRAGAFRSLSMRDDCAPLSALRRPRAKAAINGSVSRWSA